jgi:Lhr-like helicase
MKKKSAGEARFSWPIAFALIALMVASVVVIVFLRLESWPARTAKQSTAELERLGKDLRAAFIDIAHLQPRITINNRVYMEQTTPVSELVVLSRRIEVEHEFLHTWMGSSKRVKLHGTFTVKAGFDLQQNLSIDIRPDQIVIQLPHAQILDVTQDQVEVLAFENGFWNRISGEDVQNELSILPQLAREKAAEAGLSVEAERALQKQLDERVHTPQPLRLIFTNTAKIDLGMAISDECRA